MSVRKKHIGSMVSKMISKYELSPAIDVAKVAKELEIEIVYESTDENLSGFLLRDSKVGTTVIGVNRKHPVTRRRFTIAHEIGHYLLHDYEGFHFDGDEQAFQVREPHPLVIRKRDEVSSQGSDLEEREANCFAAELLMPLHFLHEEVRMAGPIDLFGDSDNKLKEMAKKFGVSSQALTYRLTNLGFIQ